MKPRGMRSHHAKSYEDDFSHNGFTKRGFTNRLYCLSSLNTKRRAWRYYKRIAWLMSTWLHVFQKEFLNQRSEGKLGPTMGLFPQTYNHCASSSKTRLTRSAFSSERVGSCTILGVAARASHSSFCGSDGEGHIALQITLS